MFLCKIKIIVDGRISNLGIFEKKSVLKATWMKINYFKQLYLISISSKIGPGMVKRKPVEPGRFDKNQLHFYVKERIYIYIFFIYTGHYDLVSQFHLSLSTTTRERIVRQTKGTGHKQRMEYEFATV